MVAVPYLALGSVGYLIYRGVKKNAAYRAALGGSPAVDSSNHLNDKSNPMSSTPTS